MKLQGVPAVKKECRFCGEKTIVYRDTTLCEDCDSDSVWCSVCRDRFPDDSTCRHLQRMDWGEWGGVGGGDMGESEIAKWIRGCMWDVAGALGWRDSQLLSRSFREHKYKFFYSDSLLGGSMRLHLIFGALEFEESIGLQENLQQWCNWMYRNVDRDEFTLVASIYAMFSLWAGDHDGDDLGLAKTPEADIQFANALDAAMACYG